MAGAVSGAVACVPAVLENSSFLVLFSCLLLCVVEAGRLRRWRTRQEAEDKTVKSTRGLPKRSPLEDSHGSPRALPVLPLKR